MRTCCDDHLNPASTVTVDGESVGTFRAGEPQRVSVPLGEHLVVATSEDGESLGQAVASVTGDSPAVVAIGLASDIAERLDREAGALARRHEEARRDEEAADAAARAEEARQFFEEEAAARDPFPGGGDGTFLDRQTGFRWTAQGQPSSGGTGWLWTEANSYCESLSLAGSTDWHLPSQEELDLVLRRLDLGRYAWGCCTIWSASRPFAVADRLWVELPSSPLQPPQWSNEVRDISGRRFTHRAVCVDGAQR